MNKELILKKIKELELLLEEDTPLYVDEDTGLMWSESSNYRMGWHDAIKYAENCRDGGYTDWRLPTKSELVSIIDNTKYNPACKDSNMKSDDYWSATNRSDIMPYAWGVDFSGGYIGYYCKSSHFYVRCVRASQPT